MALIFCAAGISKIRHAGLEWIASDSLALLLLRQQYHISDGEPLTRWGILVARHGAVARALALMVVAIETLFPLALVSRHARYLLVPAGFAMLLGIRVVDGTDLRAVHDVLRLLGAVGAGGGCATQAGLGRR